MRSTYPDGQKIVLNRTVAPPTPTNHGGLGAADHVPIEEDFLRLARLWRGPKVSQAGCPADLQGTLIGVVEDVVLSGDVRGPTLASIPRGWVCPEQRRSIS